MFINKKEPIHTVKVEQPDPVFAQQLLEQFGGATGELSAALQYWVQSFHTEDALKDPLIYYFAMLGKRFGMRQARICLTFALVKPPDLTGGVCASPCNLIVRDRLTY